MARYANHHMVRITVSKKKAVYILLIVIGVMLISFGIYQYVRLAREVERLRVTPKANQEEIKKENAKLIEEVKKRISVPDDETPTVATVTDVEKLKGNQFFVNAKNGDKVLIYSSTKKAILFRPDGSKVIEVGPVSIGTPSAAIAAEQPIQFVLYNGTESIGLTKKYEATLKAAIQNAMVIDRDNAKKRDYPTSVIVDLAGTHTKEIVVMSERLGIPIGPLPDGEVKPNAGTYLIILGEDKK